jgi:hypothetical protein
MIDDDGTSSCFCTIIVEIILNTYEDIWRWYYKLHL